MTRREMQQYMHDNQNAVVRALPGKPTKNHHGKPGRPANLYRYRIAYIGPNKIVDDALSGSESREWQDALKDEYDALIRNGTWTLTELQTNARAIKTRWVLDKKNEAGGIRYKARLVVRAFGKLGEIGVGETYAPVIHGSSVKVLLSHALKNDLKIHHIDVKNAYLNAPLKEEVYIEQPYLYEKNKRLVCKLHKAMYGLRQAARCWNEYLTEILSDLGLRQFQSEECIYATKENTLIVGAYVDDLLVISHSEEIISNFKKRLIAKIRVTDNGEVTRFIGMNVRRSESEIAISQQELIEELIEKCDLQDGNGSKECIPISTGTILDIDELDQPCNDVKVFQSIVGSLMYIAGCTRPDIQYVANQLGKYMSNPMDKHMKVAKHVVRYLKRTAATELVFRKQHSSEIAVYADADFAGEDKSFSTSGIGIFYAGNLIAWSSVRQRLVALSTCEAEVNAMVEGATGAMYYRELLSELLMEDINWPTKIYNDNESARDLLKTGGKHSRNKHYKRRINFLKGLIKDEVIEIHHLSTTELLADAFTKPLPEKQFLYLMNKTGIRFKSVNQT